MTYIPLLRTPLYFRSGLHWWQLAGKTNVCGFIGANGSPRILLTIVPQMHSRPLHPSFKLVLIYLTPLRVKAESTPMGFELTPVRLAQALNQLS